MATPRDGHGPPSGFHFLLKLTLSAGDHASCHQTTSQHTAETGGITIRNSAQMAAIFSASAITGEPPVLVARALVFGEAVTKPKNIIEQFIDGIFSRFGLLPPEINIFPQPLNLRPRPDVAFQEADHSTIPPTMKPHTPKPMAATRSAAGDAGGTNINAP
ncbi:hypothetical protein [Acetobacter sp.]|uniref:hypothetical protein n=1 Tax=Acetobacter sp. TaxID=440 RepID=UPI0039EBCD68